MSEKEIKKRKRHFDRVTLEGPSLERLDSWIKQVEAVKPGVILSRREILKWLLDNMPERLTGAQEKGLADEYYSELRYIQFAAREIKAAAIRGERLTLKEIEQRGTEGKMATPRKLRKVKVESLSIPLETPSSELKPKADSV